MAVLGWGKDPYGAVAGWFGTGANVTGLTAGIATITGLGNMSPLSVGRALSLYGATNLGNNGTFLVAEYVSASSVKVANPNAVVESGFNWIERLQTQESIYGASARGVGTSILHAVATSTRIVQVTLSGEPLHSSTFVGGDALNPSTWTVQRNDTMAFLHVVGVSPVTQLIYGLLTLEEFADVSVLHSVSSNKLCDVAGFILKPPTSASFYGLLDENEVSQAAHLAKQRVTSRDLNNSQTPSSMQALSGGTLTVNTNGDYDNVSGKALVQKLILRRLISRPGDFFHLPKYGIGLREKEPIPVGNMGKLRIEIERQIRLEPEVADVVVSLELASNGVLTVKPRVVLHPTGEVIAFSLPVGGAGLSL
jgi:hypothetical protein